MNKIKYEAPELYVVKVSVEDVIMASDDLGGDWGDSDPHNIGELGR